jgi:hypothetical protein
MVKRGFIDPAVLQVLRDTTGGAGAISDRGDSRE